MKRILYVHHSAELYGSDKVLLSLVEGLDKTRYEPIVVLPEKGPLMASLGKAGIKTLVLPVARIGRSTMSLKGILTLPAGILKSIIAFNSAFRGVYIDAVHSNTLAVLSGALWSKLNGIPHVWHVHEMIVHPPFIRHFFPWILKHFASRVICVSDAVRLLLLEDQPCLNDKTVVVRNGIQRNIEVDLSAVARLRNHVDCDNDTILVALVGRINRWKGHSLLVEAADILWRKGIKNIKYLIAGNVPPRQEVFREILLSRIAASPAKETFFLMDYQENVWNIWDACDIAVVPSVEPEPFGMVAIEAMASGKPVIAAAHGGLAEIVIDQQTGLLFKPGDAVELANALEELVINGEKREFLGSNGLKRVQNSFSLITFITSLDSLYQQSLRLQDGRIR